MHLKGRRLDATLYIDQNTSQTCQPEFLKIWRMCIFSVEKTGRFELKQEHFKIAKKWNPGYSLTLWVSVVINRSFLGVLQEYEEDINVTLKRLRHFHLNNVIFSYLKINSIRNRFGELDKIIDGNIDIFCIAGTKLD